MKHVKKCQSFFEKQVANLYKILGYLECGDSVTGPSHCKIHPVSFIQTYWLKTGRGNCGTLGFDVICRKRTFLNFMKSCSLEVHVSI